MRVTTLVAIFLGFVVTACGPSMTTFPDDENGDVLRRMQAEGDDLSKPRDIEFQFVFKLEPNSRHFASEVQAKHGLKAETARYEERRMWQATVTKHMVPTHQEITRLEQKLTELAEAHTGEADGWGCMQVEKE
jgi:hypothetical protein